MTRKQLRYAESRVTRQAHVAQIRSYRVDLDQETATLQIEEVNDDGDSSGARDVTVPLVMFDAMMTSLPRFPTMEEKMLSKLDQILSFVPSGGTVEDVPVRPPRSARGG